MSFFVLSDVELLSMDSTKASCWVNNKLRAHEEQWKEDDCTFCQCVDGEPHCTAMACKQSCQNPVKIPGECCPFCEGIKSFIASGKTTMHLFYIYYNSCLAHIYLSSTLPHILHVGGSCGLQLCHRGHVGMGSLRGRPQSILQAAGSFVFLYYPCPPK